MASCLEEDMMEREAHENRGNIFILDKKKKFYGPVKKWCVEQRDESRCKGTAFRKPCVLFDAPLCSTAGDRPSHPPVRIRYAWLLLRCLQHGLNP